MSQVILFLAVGFTTFLIDVLVTSVLYSFAHLPAYLASAVGFLSGFFFSFPMNRKKVFRHTDKDRFGIKTQILFYICLSIFNLLVTSALVEGIVYLGINIAVAKVLVTGLIAVWNFFIFKFVVFSKDSKSSSSTESAE